MLSYRHQFHAGNVSDVFKHALLSRLLIALSRKDKPYFMLDTHAGLGLYDLEHPWSQKTAEWRMGIGRIWARADAPAALQPYLEIVRADNPDGHLRHYPGSPRIARKLIDYSGEVAQIESLRRELAKLEAAQQERTASNLARQQYDADVQAAAAELRAVLRDDDDAIDALEAIQRADAAHILGILGMTIH